MPQSLQDRTLGPRCALGSSQRECQSPCRPIIGQFTSCSHRIFSASARLNNTVTEPRRHVLCKRVHPRTPLDNHCPTRRVALRVSRQTARYGTRGYETHSSAFGFQARLQFYCLCLINLPAIPLGAEGVSQPFPSPGRFSSPSQHPVRTRKGAFVKMRVLGTELERDHHLEQRRISADGITVRCKSRFAPGEVGMYCSPAVRNRAALSTQHATVVDLEVELYLYPYC